jgi:lantibiotic modifying enzyme
MWVGERLLKSKIFEIEGVIRHYDNNDIGLFTGASGFCLFYAKLYEYTRSEIYLDQCHRWVDFIIHRFTQQEDLQMSFCRGVTGILWLIEYLKKKDLLSADDFFYADIEKVIYKTGLTQLGTGYYDFLHGSGGAVMFALKRAPTKESVLFLESWVQALDKCKIEDEFGIKWVDVIDPSGRKDAYNLGLAHGTPSIINLLARINGLGIAKQKTYDLILPATNWLIRGKLEDKNPVSLYPSRIIGEGKRSEASKLAWCYGDLGIAWSLLMVGSQFDNPGWKREGLAAVEAVTNRIEALSNPNLDAGFCHGTAGIAHLFKKLHAATGQEACFERYLFWLGHTLDQARFVGGPASYKFYNGTSDTWVNELGMLTGLSGVGMVLLSYLNPDTSWDECFLLSY